MVGDILLAGNELILTCGRKLLFLTALIGDGGDPPTDSFERQRQI